MATAQGPFWLRGPTGQARVQAISLLKLGLGNGF